MKKNFIAKRHQNFKVEPLSMTDVMAKRYDDVINLSVGDPDYEVDKRILESMHKDALKGHTKYTDFPGDEELRQETINWYKEDYGYEFGLDEIIITSGGTHAMYLLMESILDEEDEVIAIAPYYTFYTPQVEMAGGKLVVAETRGENNFDIEIDKIEEKISDKTKAIILNTPNNPTGKVYKEENIKKVIELAEKHDFLVIADDIYTSLNYTENDKPICYYGKNSNKIVTIYSYSKDFCMTGFRVGHVIAHKDIIKTIQNVNESVIFTVNAMVQRAGIYAIKNRFELREDIKKVYKDRVYYAYERINKINNMKCLKPEGTFYLFIDIKETGMKSENLWEDILDEAHVLVLPGNGFGEAGEGYLRIACTVNNDTLNKAFNRIEKMDIFK